MPAKYSVQASGVMKSKLNTLSSDVDPTKTMDLILQVPKVNRDSWRCVARVSGLVH